MLRKIPKDRHCFWCRSNRTYLQEGKYPDWHRIFNRGFLCRNCYWRLIIHPIRNPKRIGFQDKRVIVLTELVPTDTICQKCGLTNKDSKIKYGQRLSYNHTNYDKSNYLAHTILLCCSCHRKFHLYHKRLGEPPMEECFQAWLTEK